MRRFVLAVVLFCVIAISLYAFRDEVGKFDFFVDETDQEQGLGQIVYSVQTEKGTEIYTLETASHKSRLFAVFPEKILKLKVSPNNKYLSWIVVDSSGGATNSIKIVELATGITEETPILDPAVAKIPFSMVDDYAWKPDSTAIIIPYTYPKEGIKYEKMVMEYQVGSGSLPVAFGCNSESELSVGEVFWVNDQYFGYVDREGEVSVCDLSANIRQVVASEYDYVGSFRSQGLIYPAFSSGKGELEVMSWPSREFTQITETRGFQYILYFDQDGGIYYQNGLDENCVYYTNLSFGGFEKVFCLNSDNGSERLGSLISIGEEIYFTKVEYRDGTGYYSLNFYDRETGKVVEVRPFSQEEILLATQS